MRRLEGKVDSLQHTAEALVNREETTQTAADGVARQLHQSQAALHEAQIQLDAARWVLCPLCYVCIYMSIYIFCRCITLTLRQPCTCKNLVLQVCTPAAMLRLAYTLLISCCSFCCNYTRLAGLMTASPYALLPCRVDREADQAHAAALRQELEEERAQLQQRAEEVGKLTELSLSGEATLKDFVAHLQVRLDSGRQHTALITVCIETYALFQTDVNGKWPENLPALVQHSIACSQMHKQ